MNTVSADSLIHFTKNFSAIKNILSNGLRYSYALEHFQSYAPFPAELLEDEDYNIEGIAIPMICFCDIPLNLAQEHSREYGEYFIAFDKFSLKLLLRERLNPVFYINSEISYDVKDFLEQEFSNTRYARISDFMLAMSKPVSGSNLKGVFKEFYNEREWRVFYYSNDNPYCEWERNIRMKVPTEFHDLIRSKNQNLHQSDYAYLNLRIHRGDIIKDLVTCIGIKNDNYRDRIIKFLQNTKTILGFKNITEDIRLNLISKIVSFERIKTDF